MEDQAAGDLAREVLNILSTEGDKPCADWESAESVSLDGHRPIRGDERILFTAQQRQRDPQGFDLPFHLQDLLFFRSEHFYYVSHGFTLQMIAAVQSYIELPPWQLLSPL